MSAHDNETVDFSVVPHSKGMHPRTYVIIFIGLCGIFIMGGLSIHMAGFGHMWPPDHTLRMDLNSMPASTH